MSANLPALPSFTSETLGCMAVALLPANKVRLASPRGKTFQEEIHEFLITNFTGYTVASGNISGWWKDAEGKELQGQHIEYKVALPNDPAALGTLQAFLASLAFEMKEECLYLEIGSHASLIFAQPL